MVEDEIEDVIEEEASEDDEELEDEDLEQDALAGLPHIDGEDDSLSMYLHEIGRVRYDYATDDEVLAAFQLVAKTEGILPALESAHALAYVIKHAPVMPSHQVVVVNLSGRGDKDVDQLARRLPR